MMKKGLILGRFQPLHVGHVDLFRQMELDGIDLFLIGICTKPMDTANPFSYDMRKLMIENVLKGRNYLIYEIPDINDPPNYEKHVKRIIKELDKNTTMFSSNPYVTGCFKGYKIKKPKKILEICGTTLREKMMADEKWKEYIPKCNLGIFQKHNLIDIIKRNIKIQEKILKTEVVFRGKYINRVEKRTVKLPNGKVATREIVIAPSAVAIVPITKDNKILLIKQYRSPLQRENFEIPAGIINKNELPIDTAKRELMEEIGAKAELIKICDLNPSPGFCNYKMTIFYGIIESNKLKPKPDENEFITTIKMPIEEAYSMVLDNKISDPETQVGIRHYYNEIYKKNEPNN